MNIIKNADFSLWENYMPCNWQLKGGFPLASKTAAMTGCFNLQVIELEKGCFNYEKKLFQNISLIPNTAYRLDIRMHATGSFFLKVRLTNPETRTIISEDNLGWFGFLYWQNIPVRIRSKQSQEYLLEVIFTSEGKKEGEIAFELDNIMITQIENPGFTVFTHSIMQSYNSEIPSESILQPQGIYQTAIRGEYHACCLGMKTDCDIASVNLEIIDFGILPKSSIKLNIIEKQLLLKPTKRNIAANQIQRWWLTLSPSATSQPGNFELKLKLKADKYSENITVKLKVLDIELPATDIPMLVYFSERYMPGKLLTKELRHKYYSDMRAHGMTSATIYNNPDADDSSEPDFSHNWQFSPKEHQWFKANKKDNMLSKEKNLDSRFNWGLEQEIETMLGCGLCNKEFPVIWLTGKKTLMLNNVDAWGKMSSGEKIEKSINLWHSHENWPEPLYQIVDEPDDLEERVLAAQEIFSSLGNLDIKVKTITANVSPQKLGSKYNVWVQPSSRISESYQKMTDDFNADLWVYDCATSNRNMAMSRALYGFWAHLSGVKGVAQWAYYDAFEEFADNDEETHADNSLTTLSRVGLSPDGPIPTLAWEATREGTLDFRISKLFCNYREELNRMYNNTKDENHKHKFKQILDQVNEVYERVLDSIPLEAFAIFRAESIFYDRLMFKPPIGPGNLDIAAEIKRYALLPHILQMKNILEGNENED
jgi:hypothetical protein